MNNKEYKISKILFIKGVFIKDCIPIDDIFDQQLMEQLNIEAPIDIFESIPTNFTGLETWVKTTNLNCWYCDLNFGNTPVFIPKLIEPASNSKGYNISTHGCFCSFCCAMSYNNLHNYKLCKNVHIKDMLLFLYKIYNGKSVKEIFPSPSKYEMKQYGGSTDSIVYRNSIHTLKKYMTSLEINNT
jgi:hypothetical protein